MWKARTGRRWWRYPLAVEWGLEWLYYRLRGLALFDVLELAGRTTVLIVAILWVLETGDRAKERHYRAWELINSARGSSGDGGRRDALQDLNRDGVSLAAAPLERAYLPKVDLKSADLARANLQGADLWSTNLQGADLWSANLQGAILWLADLQGADLTGANLRGANLQGANLSNARLQGAILAGANLQAANLTGADDLTQEQLDVAKGDDDTQLPEGLTRPAHWKKAEESQSPPAAQPDDAERAPAASGAPDPAK